MALASASSPFPSTMFGLVEDDRHDDDFILEDAGFFGLPASSSSQPFDAQRALNELGLQPSPPKARRYVVEEDDEDMPFDLEHELEMEEQRLGDEDTVQVEEEIPEDHMQDDEDVLESNGVLQISATLAKEAPQMHASLPVVINKHILEAPQPVASTSHIQAPLKSPAPVAEDIDTDLGMNGLPKYIPSGIATATLLDGSVIRFEKKRRMKGWKVSSDYGEIPSCALCNADHALDA
jgi:hypothetical protein